MVVIHAHITVVAGREGAFEAAARELAAATLEREPGIRRYDYTRLSEPATYLAVLAFDDYDAFIEHQASQHHHVIAGGDMRDMIASIRLERVDPVPGCSALAPPDADGEEIEQRQFEAVDEAVLASRYVRYRERYPLTPAPWWDATT
jgi:quinol monooxygenase YgiN